MTASALFMTMAAITSTAIVPRTSGVLTISGRPHPYLIEGTGLTCIVTGPAPSYPPQFSDRAKQQVRFVYVDFKNSWNLESPHGVEAVTMDSLVDEIDQIRKGLALERVCVIGHSAPGLVAMEYALRHPEHTSHAVLIGVEPYFNQAWLKARADFWERDASPERKAALAKNAARFPDDLLRGLSPLDAFALRYVRNGPKYFFDPTYDFYWAWAGKQLSGEMVTYFLNTILGDYDPRPRLAKNTVPMLLILGRYDYNIPYREWDSARKNTPHLTSHVFQRSGHFPMIEEAGRFDDILIRWLGAPQRQSPVAMKPLQ